MKDMNEIIFKGVIIIIGFIVCLVCVCRDVVF